ncbi:bifunctional lysylphosphatidylglycerol flippase/synthetase MprF [Ciceribacter selenitireducens]|uniref:bifunctional lysylphosphatidylglycerol flippase/synthetase MprF n=1 Tax=Ciceribacter selenitireducens TaxID=448181 RepID=UPI000E1FB887|nr:bifunctional lysylphosphatidylglycerol flippase/synthetase MprF [Ciceribacter selenitireducens]
MSRPHSHDETVLPPDSTPNDPNRHFRLLAGYGKPLAAILTLVVFAFVGYAIYRLTEEVRYDDVVQSLAATPPISILMAVIFTVLSFATLCLYDWNALAYIGRKRRFGEVALTAFSAYAVGNVAGFGALSGGAIRYRAYSRTGLRPDEIGRIIAFVTLSFSLGLAVITSVALVPMAPEVAPLVGLDPIWLRTTAVLVLAGLALLYLMARRRVGPDSIRGLRFADSRLLSRQFLVTVLDIAFSSSVAYVLLPADAAISWPAFFAVYSVAIGLGIVSHVPGGIGVFEAVMIAALGGQVSADQILAALFVYRVIYYVLPLLVAIGIVSYAELRQFAAHPLSSGLASATARMAPPLLSALTLILGVMLVLSSVTPTPSDNMAFLSTLLPLPIIEGAHFIASLLGLLLVIAARGIAQRLDGAWWTTFLAAIAALGLSLLKAVALIEASLLAVLVAGLFVSRRLFVRPASLLRQAPNASWLLAIAVIFMGAVVVMLFVYRDVDYSHDLWWQFEFEAEAPRSLRAMLGLTILSSAIAVFSLLRPASLPVLPATGETLLRAVAIVAAQDIADANLVRTGDKSVMFSPDGESFVMYGKQGRSLIAFLDPVGPRKARADLVWQFVETARAAGCRAVFYQASPALLPALADAGMKAFKLGESAHVELARFDLKGGRWANLRQAAARAERDGLDFEIVPADQVAAILDDLRAVSDAWLREHNTREKGFSLGAFTDEYMLSQPVALLRFEGRIVAFANILLTDTKEEASIDLMRFAPDAPKGTMDFLFVSLLSRLREEGYRHFNLGMAPLSGLSRREVAPVWDRIANTFFEHGERFYNFKGLRAFKSKFHPEWQPRYLAVSGGLSPVLALLDATLLISGGLKGVVKR